MSGNLFADGSDDTLYGTASLNVAPDDKVRSSNADNGDRQRSDLASLFSIDDFNPFSANEDHFNVPNPADNTVGGNRRRALFALNITESTVASSLS